MHTLLSYTLDNQNAEGWTNRWAAFCLYIVRPYLMLYGPNTFQYGLIWVIGQFKMEIFITCKTVPWYFKLMTKSLTHKNNVKCFIKAALNTVLI